MIIVLRAGFHGLVYTLSRVLILADLDPTPLCSFLVVYPGNVYWGFGNIGRDCGVSGLRGDAPPGTLQALNGVTPFAHPSSL